MTVQDLAEKIHNGDNIRLIDVRSEAEHQQAKLANSELIPMHNIPLKLDELQQGDESLVIYCRSGARSMQVAMYLKQEANIDAINLRGGILAWAQAGYEYI